MNRPNVVLYVSASIDGRIALGPNKTMMDMDERDKVLGTEEEWQEFSPEVESDVFAAIDIKNSVDQRQVTGGPAENEILRLIAEERKKLQ